MTPKHPRLDDGRPGVTGVGQELYRKARHIIPGGTQLLSKRPEMFLPDQWPAYFSRAKGAGVWDMDGREYLDFTHCGVGTCALGYADPDVNAAVENAVRNGTMTTLNCPEEVELAELLLDLHPWAQMARFGRAGGEMMAIAIRIARAATGRDRVTFCGYHGWQDWYLAANIPSIENLDEHLIKGLSPAGVPSLLGGSALPFRYNDLEALGEIVSAHGADLAAIVMEPRRATEPAPGFLEGARALADSCGAVLVFDEITSGWRMTKGGIHLAYGVSPDIAAFAKALSNGYPMSAIIGTQAVMEAAQDSFISSTYWTERIGPVAALATVRKHIAVDLPNHLIRAGERVQAGWRQAADATGLDIAVSGIPPLSMLAFNHKQPDTVMTYFTQEMLSRGYLTGQHFYPMLTHTDELIDGYLDNVADVFAEMTHAVETGDVESRLKGPVKHSGFQRLTE